MSKPKLNIIGKNGNAFSVLGEVSLSAKKAKWSKEEIECFMKDATSGDYDNLLRVCMDSFEVS